MATASSSRSASENPNQQQQLIIKEMRSHEVAIGELNSLASSRAVYQKNGNIFFRRNIKTAIAFEQKQLDAAKAELQKLNTA